MGPVQTDTVVAIPADAVARDALLRRLGTLTRVDHPAVEPVGAAVARPDGTLVVPRGAEHSTDLATVLSVRGRCTVAEASGLAVDVAQGLAALHSAGLVQGVIGPSDVVIGFDGRARLRPRLDLPPSPAGEAEDVHRLARLVESVVGPQDGDELVALRAALAPALADDPPVRPEAGTLAARVHDAVAPEPFRVPEPAVLAAAALARRSAEPVEVTTERRPARRASSASTPATRTRRSTSAGRSGRTVRRGGSGRRRGRAVWGSVGVVATVGVLVVVGLQLSSVRPGAGDLTEPTDLAEAVDHAEVVDATGAVAPSEPAEAAAGDQDQALLDSTDPTSAAAELTRRRVEMLTGDRPLEDVVVAGTPAHAAATDDVARTQASGVRISGALVDVTDVRRVPDAGSSAEDPTAEVEVVYLVEAHDQVGADGAVVQVPRSEVQTDVLRLAWTAEGWRVTDVR
jgi:hypothetical protein